MGSPIPMDLDWGVTCFAVYICRRPSWTGLASGCGGGSSVCREDAARLISYASERSSGKAFDGERPLRLSRHSNISEPLVRYNLLPLLQRHVGAVCVSIMKLSFELCYRYNERPLRPSNRITGSGVICCHFGISKWAIVLQVFDFTDAVRGQLPSTVHASTTSQAADSAELWGNRRSASDLDYTPSSRSLSAAAAAVAAQDALNCPAEALLCPMAPLPTAAAPQMTGSVCVTPPCAADSTAELVEQPASARSVSSSFSFGNSGPALDTHNEDATTPCPTHVRYTGDDQVLLTINQNLHKHIPCT